MEVLTITLATDGSIKHCAPDFKITRGSYGNILINIEVPKVLMVDEVFDELNSNITGNNIRIGAVIKTVTGRNLTTKKYELKWIKDFIGEDEEEYSLYQRPMPKVFTMWETAEEDEEITMPGGLEIITNVINWSLNGAGGKVEEIAATPKLRLDVYPSKYITDEEEISNPSDFDLLQSQVQVINNKLNNLNAEGVPINEITDLAAENVQQALEQLSLRTDSQQVDTLSGDGNIVDNTDPRNPVIKHDDTKLDIIDSPTKLSDLTNDSGFITKTVNDLTNYYLKNETYTKNEIIALINVIKTVSVSIVQILPTADATTYFNDSKIIYFVPVSAGSNNDYYDEFICVRNGTEGNYVYSFEKIGNTRIDLSGYVKKTLTIAGIDLQNNISKSALQTALTDTTHNFVTDAEKTKLAGIASGAEVNVQSDWNQTDSTADDFIKNKPVIPAGVIVDNTLNALSNNAISNSAVTNEFANKMDKTNPTGTGALSINRKENTTIGAFSVSEGALNEASGIASHATGTGTIASGEFSSTKGRGTIAQRSCQFVFGELNIADTQGNNVNTRGEFVEIVGNGTDNNNRSNARTLDWQGNEVLAGKITPKGGISDGKNSNYKLLIPDTTNWTSDKTITTDEDLAEKVGKTRVATRVYGTDSNGNQTFLMYTVEGISGTIPQRNDEGGLEANGYQCHNSKSYSKCFYNNSANQQCCRIGILGVNGPNQVFCGRIYSHEGYGNSDNNQQIIDFNVTIQNDQALHGYATATYNFFTGNQIKLYFVKTSNNWEWEVYLKMHAWSSAFFEVNIPSLSRIENWTFTFDSLDNNFAFPNEPSNPALTITPKMFFSARDYVGITGNSGVSYYADSPTFVMVYLNNNMGGISDASGLNIEVSSNNSTWYELCRTSSTNAYPKFECISAYVPAGQYFRYNVWGDKGHYEAKYIKG